MLRHRRLLACMLVVSAVVFNMALCLVNTHVSGIGASHVIAAEILIAVAAMVLGYRAVTNELFLVLLLLAIFFSVIWLVTGVLNIKVVRDIVLPFVFFLCGAACARPRDGDRLLYALTALVFVVAMFEWLFLDAFTKLFNVLNYYIAKGRIDEFQSVDVDFDLYLSGMRTMHEGRTLFPELGFHRVSSVFLEPVSVGNFAAIGFAWLLVRFRQHPTKNALFMALLAILIVLADNRFAAVACFLLILLRAVPPPPATLLYATPFVAIIGVITFAAMHPFQDVDQTFIGRLVGSGRLVSTFDTNDWLGFSTRPISDMLDVDSGYAYALYAIGLPGLALLWYAFSFTRPASLEAAQYRMLLAAYLCLSFFVSQSALSIKTAALAWFLLGVSQHSLVAASFRGTVAHASRPVQA